MLCFLNIPKDNEARRREKNFERCTWDVLSIGLGSIELSGRSEYFPREQDSTREDVFKAKVGTRTR
ncbi:MAG: hypothetical protein EBR81_01005 [Proteobacteria bacterium]|nr:hypothetical protein [Pseudomonadota bacterium]